MINIPPCLVGTYTWYERAKDREFVYHLRDAIQREEEGEEEIDLVW